MIRPLVFIVLAGLLPALLISCLPKELQEQRAALLTSSRDVFQATCVGHTEGAHYGVNQIYEESKKATLEYCYMPALLLDNGDVWAPAEITNCMGVDHSAHVTIEFKESGAPTVETAFGTNHLVQGMIDSQSGATSLEFANEFDQSLQLMLVGEGAKEKSLVKKNRWKLNGLSAPGKNQLFKYHDCESAKVGEVQMELPPAQTLSGVVGVHDASLGVYYLKDSQQEFVLDYLESSRAVQSAIPTLVGKQVVVRGHVYGNDEYGYFVLVQEIADQALLADRYDPRAAGTSTWMVKGEAVGGGDLVKSMMNLWFEGSSIDICFSDTSWQAAKFVTELMIFPQVEFDKEAVRVTSNDPMTPGNTQTVQFEKCP